MDFEIIAVIFFIGGCLALGLFFLGVKIHEYFNKRYKRRYRIFRDASGNANRGLRNGMRNNGNDMENERRK